MIDNTLQISINTSKMVLSSNSLFYKTENFIKQICSQAKENGICDYIVGKDCSIDEIF